MSVLCITLNPALDMTLNVPTLQIGAVNRVAHSQTHAAGKGLNVAQILHGLGHDVVVSGFWGAENRAPLEHLCQQKNEGSAPKFVNEFVLVDGNTRTNIKVVDDVGVTTDINGQGFVVNAKNKEALYDKIKALIELGNIHRVVISGSLPQGFLLEDFENLLALVEHLPVACDVSGEALKLCLTKRLWLIKPNDEELASATGKACSTLDLQAQLLKDLNAQIDHVLISQGELGVNWFFTNECLHANPPPIKIASTVGAGDTLLAGMVHALTSESDNKQKLALATALSAHAVSIVGFGVPDEARLAELLSNTTVTECAL